MVDHRLEEGMAGGDELGIGMALQIFLRRR